MAMVWAQQTPVCRATISSLAFSRASLLLPPTSLSLDPSSVDVSELSSLLASTHQNCLQFPEVRADGSVQPAPPSRLRLALQHSTVVVSVHLRGPLPGEDYMERADEENNAVENVSGRNWFLGPFFPRRRSSRKLVAFGRATSDHNLTASIYDLVVAPSLQRQGLGRLVLQRIVRELTQRGICDIAALISPELRSFFLACGFSDDKLGSTTMLYTRNAVLSNSKDSGKPFGKKYLLVPPSLKPGIPAFKQQRSDRSLVQVEPLK